MVGEKDFFPDEFPTPIAACWRPTTYRASSRSWTRETPSRIADRFEGHWRECDRIYERAFRKRRHSQGHVLLFCPPEAKPNRIGGKSEVVLDTRKALFFSRGDKLAVAQKCSGGIVVIAGDSENMHELLLLGPAHVVQFRWMFTPLCGTTLDVKRIREQVNDQTERQDHNRIQDGEKYAGLKVPNLVRQALPRVPKSLQILCKRLGHEIAVRLEQRVDERCKSRALRQDDESRGEKND